MIVGLCGFNRPLVQGLKFFCVTNFHTLVHHGISSVTIRIAPDFRATLPNWQTYWPASSKAPQYEQRLSSSLRLTSKRSPPANARKQRTAQIRRWYSGTMEEPARKTVVFIWKSCHLQRCYAMSILSKDTDSEVSKYFGIEPLEEVTGVLRDTFLKSYYATDNYVCRLINARH